MKKTCTICNATFTEGEKGFDPVRLVDMCFPCIGNDKAHLKLLREARTLDLKLAAVGKSIARGVKANVTSGPQQVSLITIIRYGPCTVGEIADIVGLDQSSITLHLKKFEHEGLVSVIGDTDDRRKKLVRPTRKARGLFFEQHP